MILGRPEKIKTIGEGDACGESWSATRSLGWRSPFPSATRPSPGSSKHRRMLNRARVSQARRLRGSRLRWSETLDGKARAESRRLLPRRPAGTRWESRSRSSAELRWLHLGWGGSGRVEPTAGLVSSASEPMTGSAQPAAVCEQGTAAARVQR